jgi:hypothetical protein
MPILPRETDNYDEMGDDLTTIAATEYASSTTAPHAILNVHDHLRTASGGATALHTALREEQTRHSSPDVHNDTSIPTGNGRRKKRARQLIE